MAPLPLFKPKDLLILLGLVVLGTIAWFVPQRQWWRLCRRLAPAARCFASESAADSEAYIRHCMRSRPLSAAPTEIIDTLAAHAIMRTLEILRTHKPGPAWTVPTELRGATHIHEAQREGRGAVLWIGYFGANNLPPQAALCDAGFRVSHLSELTHGFSSTRFGIRWLNPVRTAAEMRFLKERIVLGSGSPAPAIRQMRRRLAENGVVSINVRHKAARPVRTAFLDGAIELASGALDIAYAARAPVLPVFAIREPSGRYRIIVEEALPLAYDLDRRTAIRQAADAYVRRLEPYVLAHPEQWAGWDHPVAVPADEPSRKRYGARPTFDVHSTQ